MEIIRASFKVTIDRQTRWIECESWDAGERFHSTEYVGMARVGRTGSKLWPSKIWIFRQKDGSYRESMYSVHLNRSAAIVGWHDASTARYASQHNSSGFRLPNDTGHKA